MTFSTLIAALPIWLTNFTPPLLSAANLEGYSFNRFWIANWSFCKKAKLTFCQIGGRTKSFFEELKYQSVCTLEISNSFQSRITLALKEIPSIAPLRKCAILKRILQKVSKYHPDTFSVCISRFNCGLKTLLCRNF